MKRLFVLIIPSAMFFLFAIVVTTIDAERTPAWHGMLRDYVAHQANTTVLQMSRAKQPWNFTADTNLPVADYGDFQVDAGPYTDTTRSTTYPVWPQVLRLPFPPKDAYCVLLKRADTQQMLFVNYFSDNLWHYGWVLQEGPTLPFSPKFMDMLRNIGCPIKR
ncbi:MAG: hypothetical protein U0350_15520 [Caldilineaceae bacterium]